MTSTIHKNETVFQLTDEQLAAVRAPVDEAVKIAAGAGTGKTTVLVERYRYLVAEKGFKPEDILVLTFTKKAAGELKKRISEIIDDDYVIMRAHIDTFDAFWFKLAMDNPYLCGIDGDFSIIDDTDKRFIHEAVIEDMITGSEKDFILKLETVDLTKIGRFLNKGFDIIDKAKQKLLSESDFRKILYEKTERYKDEFADDGIYDNEKEYIELFSRLYSLYQDRLYRGKFLEYSDVVMRVHNMLREHPEIRQRYRKKYSYILIDEMQDTSFAQYEVLKMLADNGFRNVTVVGDDKQSIYGWRDAEIDNIRDFTGREYYLTENHRSYNEILDAANFTIIRDDYFYKQKEKIALVNRRKGYKGKTAVKFFYSDKKEDEAVFTANEVINLSKDDVPLNSIAVLFRSKTYQQIFEKEFRSREIPFTALGGGYFDREEVKDIIAYLTLLENPRDIASLVRVLENPPYPLNLDSTMKIGALIRICKEEPDKNETPLTYIDILNSIISNPEIGRASCRERV